MSQSSNNTRQTKKSKALYLYTGNHGDLVGIKDYINLISYVMKKRGIDIHISNTLVPGATNLIIDEFTNYVENQKIMRFKKCNPGSNLVLVLTEFVTYKWGVESFNFFSGLQNASAITLFDIYVRRMRNDFGTISPKILSTAILLFPVFLIHIFPYALRFLVRRLWGRSSPHPVKEFLQRHHQLFYFHMRYLGLRACLPYIDAIITSHEQIGLNFRKGRIYPKVSIKNLGVIYPEINEVDVIDKLMVNKKLFIEITGSITKYRRIIIGRVNRRIVALGLHNIFGDCMMLSFSLRSKKPTTRGAYSLHPPQTKKWPYSSPTRIFRALVVDHNIPVITKNPGQNPIEDVCFVMEDAHSLVALYEMYGNRDLLQAFIGPRINKYNKIVEERNDKLVSRLIAVDR